MTSDSPEPKLTLELDDDEKAMLAALIKQTIAADPFPMSQRVRELRDPGEAGAAGSPAAAIPRTRRIGS